MSQAFFWIPAMWPEQAQEALNRFMSSHQVLGVERHFMADGRNSAWAVMVDYNEPAATPSQTKKGRVDYREILDPETFALFVALRTHRKQVAESEGIPAYAVLTNEHLAAIARLRPTTLKELSTVDGVGEGRLSKYGEGILAALRAAGVVDRPSDQEQP